MIRNPLWRRYVRLLGPDFREDVDDEIRSHLEMRTQELVDAGLDSEAARDEALRQFGDLGRVRRELLAIGKGRERVVRWRERLGDIAAGVGYALRRMRRAPVFTLGVVITFALGIGANATMFGILDQLLLRPPAHVDEPERIARLMLERVPEMSGSPDTSAIFTYPDYARLAQARSFSAAAFTPRGLVVGRGTDAREVNALLATGSYFPVLGTQPVLGRFFSAEEDVVGAAGVAVISHGFWVTHYGSDPGVNGGALDFGFGPYTIIGVAPEGFNGGELRQVDLWLPLIPAQSHLFGGARWLEEGGFDFLRIVVRLNSGVHPESAAVEASVLRGREGGEETAGTRGESRVVSLPFGVSQRGNIAGVSRVATWLMGLALLVLLIACANVTNLLLARALRDQREIAVRMALGSSRLRLVGQTLTESLLLAAAGSLTALVITYWGASVLRSTLLPDVFWAESPLGGRVPVLIAVLTFLTACVAGVLPAVQASRSDVVELLKHGLAGMRSSRRAQTRKALSVFQIALSAVLLIGAGLFVRSLQQVNSLDLGLDPEGVLLIDPVFDPGVPNPMRMEVFEQASERLRAVPGVAGASMDVSFPFMGRRGIRVRVPGRDSIPRIASGGPAVHLVEPDYFQVLRLRISRGRGIQDEDTRSAPRVAVVNETMARVVWPGQDPLGQCLIINDDPDVPGVPPCAEVVGVVEDARQSTLFEPETMSYYLPMVQGVLDWGPQGILVRVEGDIAQATGTIRRELLSLHPGIRFVRTLELRDAIDSQARSWQLGATVFSLFGLLALVVAAVGLYSLIAFGVAQRRLELAIRLALGAKSGHLRRLVLREALGVVAVGVGVGLAVALAVSSRLQPLLFEVSPRDPLVIGAVALALGGTAVLAAAVPSWRATRVDPHAALRAE